MDRSVLEGRAAFVAHDLSPMSWAFASSTGRCGTLQVSSDEGICVSIAVPRGTGGEIEAAGWESSTLRPSRADLWPSEWLVSVARNHQRDR
jgi:hypothetical protein